MTPPLTYDLHIFARHRRQPPANPLPALLFLPPRTFQNFSVPPLNFIYFISASKMIIYHSPHIFEMPYVLNESSQTRHAYHHASVHYY